MNATLDVIKRRRSVRSYTDKAVPRDVLEAVIEAGNWAPTGHNQQRWRFVVVEEKAFRQRLLEATRPGFRKWVRSGRDSSDEHHRTYMLGLFRRCLGWEVDTYEEGLDRMLTFEDGVYWSAPVVIFVIGLWAAECDLGCENIMLAAEALGLGTCIVGFGSMVTQDEEITAALELQENEKIFGPIVLGYPAIVPDPPSKKPPVVKWI